MADTPETPTPPAAEAEKPVRRRVTRRAPAAAPNAATGEAKAPRGRPAKPSGASAEAATAKTKAVPAERKPKPRGTKRAAPTTKPQPRKSARRASAKTTTQRLSERARGRWGAAAIATGIAATGAVVAALFSVRSSTPKGKAAKGVSALAGGTDVPAPVAAAEHARHNGAHQADGEDSSRSFAAGIADEGTIPN